jgi:hypothetical protein
MRWRLVSLCLVAAVCCGTEAWNYGEVRRRILRDELSTHHDLARKLPGSLKEGDATDDAHLRIDSFIIDGEPRKVIFAHPPLSLIFPVYARDGQRLVTGAATHPSSWDKGGDGVRFLVKLRKPGGKETLLGSTYIDPKGRSQDRKWHDLSFDLSGHQGEVVGLVLETTFGAAGDGSFDWAGWVEPLIVSAEPVPQPPSVVLITVGALRTDYLGCYGATETPTPGIDLLASGGFLFSQAYAASDDRIRALTSMLTCTMGEELGPEPQPGVGAETLAEAAVASGYRTAAFVSSGELVSRLGNVSRGFRIMEGSPDQRWSAEELTDRVIAWLTGRIGKRFLLWAHYEDLEFEIPDGTDVEEARRSYAKEVSDVDGQIHRLIRALADAGMEKSTVVVLSSDRGRLLGERGEVGGTEGLYPAVTRVPLVFRYPEIWRGGRRMSCLVQATDLPATVVDLTGLTMHGREGRSLVGLLSDLATMVRDEVRAASDGERMVRNSRWLYIERQRRRGSLPPGTELYDLVADPEQANNVADADTAVVSQMAGLAEDMPW